MTEREIPAISGFHSSGNTNAAGTTFAPPAVSEPEFFMNISPPSPLPSSSTPTAAAVGMTRREMRAAGLYELAPDAAAPVLPAAPVAALEPVELPVESAPAEIAPISLVPLVEPAASVAHPVTQSTLAMQVTEIENELAATVPPLVVHQAPITAIVPAVVPTSVAAPVLPVSTVPPVPTPPAPTAREAERLDVASIFGLVASADHSSDIAVDVAATAAPGSRRARRGAPSGTKPARQRREKHAKPARPARTAPQPAAVRAASDRKSIRQRATGFGVMVLVGGLFAVLALPAYADNNASSLTSASAVRTQKLAVSESAADDSTKVSRDGYTATSASDLKTLYASAIRQQNIAAYMQSGAKSQGDDYPWFAELSRNQGGGLSPLNYYYRECVDFVAWRLNRDAGSTKAPFKWVWSNLTPSGGNASQWKSAWLNHGWATGTTPQVGAVAWFPYNHVAYVSGILNDGSVALEEYNWEGQHLYTTRIIQPGDAYYLYAPPA
jgi:surface antigen